MIDINIFWGEGVSPENLYSALVEIFSSTPIIPKVSVYRNNEDGLYKSSSYLTRFTSSQPDIPFEVMILTIKYYLRNCIRIGF